MNLGGSHHRCCIMYSIHKAIELQGGEGGNPKGEGKG